MQVSAAAQRLPADRFGFDGGEFGLQFDFQMVLIHYESQIVCKKRKVMKAARASNLHLLQIHPFTISLVSEKLEAPRKALLERSLH